MSLRGERAAEQPARQPKHAAIFGCCSDAATAATGGCSAAAHYNRRDYGALTKPARTVAASNYAANRFVCMWCMQFSCSTHVTRAVRTGLATTAAVVVCANDLVAVISLALYSHTIRGAHRVRVINCGRTRSACPASSVQCFPFVWLVCSITTWAHTHVHT